MINKIKKFFNRDNRVTAKVKTLRTKEDFENEVKKGFMKKEIVNGKEEYIPVYQVTRESFPEYYLHDKEKIFDFLNLPESVRIHKKNVKVGIYYYDFNIFCETDKDISINEVNKILKIYLKKHPERKKEGLCIFDLEFSAEIGVLYNKYIYLLEKNPVLVTDKTMILKRLKKGNIT